jgi:hypothetical protein
MGPGDGVGVICHSSFVIGHLLRFKNPGFHAPNKRPMTDDE